MRCDAMHVSSRKPAPEGTCCAAVAAYRKLYGKTTRRPLKLYKTLRNLTLGLSTPTCSTPFPTNSHSLPRRKIYQGLSPTARKRPGGTSAAYSSFCRLYTHSSNLKSSVPTCPLAFAPRDLPNATWPSNVASANPPLQHRLLPVVLDWWLSSSNSHILRRVFSSPLLSCGP